MFYSTDNKGRKLEVKVRGKSLRGNVTEGKRRLRIALIRADVIIPPTREKLIPFLFNFKLFSQLTIFLAGKVFALAILNVGGGGRRLFPEKLVWDVQPVSQNV